MNLVRPVPVLVLSAFVAACTGSNSPTASTPPPTTPSTPTTATKIIGVSGDLGFGNVNMGSTADRTFTITNSGTATLTVSSIGVTGGTGTNAFTASFTTGAIAAGATQPVTIHFAPTLAQYYYGVLTVTGDQTSGTNALNISGTGVNNTPLFTMSGSGNTVFTLPATVGRVHITGDYKGYSSNFIATVGAYNAIVNVILGTSQYASGTHYDAIALTTGGGTVSITNSNGVSWSFTEVR